jgi:hypothetical protein
MKELTILHEKNIRTLGLIKFDLFVRISGSIYHRYNTRPFFLLLSIRENKIYQGNTYRSIGCNIAH